jgi:hypothetical protein
MERCVSCHYYDRHNAKSGEGKSAHTGQCRRTSPLLNPINMKSYMIEGIWPTVRDDDWCGEWKSLVRHVAPAMAHEPINPEVPAMRTAMSEARPRPTVVAAPQPGPRVPLAPVSTLPGQPRVAAVAFAPGHAD